MDPRKEILKDTGITATGVLICSGIMVAVFAALGLFAMNVLWGAVFGALIIIGNYFFMAITVSLASDKAAQGDATGAQKMIQSSSAIRLVAMGLLLFVCMKAGCNVIAVVLPLAFLRPVLTVWEFFRKKGDK